MQPYDHKDIEPKWQKQWETSQLYRADPTSGKPKEYVLDMFPYPSGEGLHVGHPKGYIATDVYARMRRMEGKEVLHPMGWDAFGLPAENYAIKTKTHPRKAVEKNVARYKEQLSMLGFSYDWSREINTTDPEYYHWTQWIFLQLFKKGLAYQSHEPINWCPSCQTGLANEDLENGVCERCGSEVEKKPMRQWVLKIRDYADRLLHDLETLDRWPESIKESQRNWIGRSEGAEIDFELTSGDSVTVFTTRADTLYGATYIVLAPEHPLLERLLPLCENKDDVIAYQKSAQQKTEIERTDATKEKTGVLLEGVSAVNPGSKETIPVYVADYVLAQYGTGAIMGVPAHDERDFEFAQKFKIPVRQVIKPTYVDSINPPRDGVENTKRNIVIVCVKHWEEDKYLLNASKDFGWKVLFTGGIEDGEDAVECAKREIQEETGYKNFRKGEILNFVHRDIFYAQHKGVNRDVEVTNVFLELENGEQDDIAPEEKELHQTSWRSRDEMIKEITHDNHRFIFRFAVEGGLANTWEGTLINSGEHDGLSIKDATKSILKKVSGREKVTYRLQDWVFSRQRYWGEPIPIIHCESCGAVPVPEEELPVRLPEVEHYEPAGTGESPLANIEEWVKVPCPSCGKEGRRETNTMPQWAGSCWYYLRYMDPHNASALVDQKLEKYWGPVDLYVGGAEHATRHLIYARFWHKFLYDIGVVSSLEPFIELHSVGLIQAEDGRKMSKRWGNVINPDDIVDQFGADSMRVYEMFMGPFENAISWSTNGLVGARRFIERVWRLQEIVAEGEKVLETELHTTIKKVGDDIAAFKFNTAVSQMMIFVNAVEDKGKLTKEEYETFLLLLAPFAPHITEELWRSLGHTDSIHKENWPSYDASKLVRSSVPLAVQFNGKTRGTIDISPEASQDEALQVVSGDQKMSKYLVGEPKKVIYVPGRIINIIV